MIELRPNPAHSKTGGLKMNQEQFRAFLVLLMCSDPWPVEEEGHQKILDTFADEESNRHGYRDWLEAYHALQH